MTGPVWRLPAALALALWAVPAGAVDLSLPGAATMTEEDSSTGAARLPSGPFADGAVPRREFPGTIRRQAWNLPGDWTSFDLIAPLRDQLAQAGFDILLDCATEDCGGFDFRFALDVLPEPGMHIDLGDFRVLTAAHDTPAGTEAVGIIASQSDSAGFVQITTVTPAGSETAATPGTVAPGPGAGSIAFQPGTLAQTLDAQGFVVLDDLDFATGSSDLGPGPYVSLQELAAYLKAHPDRQVAVVGHTDATGGLDVNISVSRRRATSVVQRLRSDYGIAASQLSAEGVGYLAPRSSNLTEAGRTANRRVEVVLTSTE